MSDVRYFVGRHTELKKLDAFLRDPTGQAALIVGQAGCGMLGRVAGKHVSATWRTSADAAKLRPCPTNA